MSMSDDVRTTLAGRAFAHLATVLPNGSPHSVPVWIDVDESDRLVMLTQSGSRKAKNIERDGRVAISAVDIDNPYRQCDLRGRVVGRGRAGSRHRRSAVAQVHRGALPLAQPEHRGLHDRDRHEPPHGAALHPRMRREAGAIGC